MTEPLDHYSLSEIALYGRRFSFPIKNAIQHNLGTKSHWKWSQFRLCVNEVTFSKEKQNSLFWHCIFSVEFKVSMVRCPFKTLLTSDFCQQYKIFLQQQPEGNQQIQALEANFPSLEADQYLRIFQILNNRVIQNLPLDQN